jgi:hypothetical protein
MRHISAGTLVCVCRALEKTGKIPNLESGCALARFITGEPNELVAQIHPCMPVILPEQPHAACLGETRDGNLKTLLLPWFCLACQNALQWVVRRKGK